MDGKNRVRLDRFGRVLIPKALRKALGLEPGDELDLEDVDGSLWLRPVGLTGGLEVREGVVVYCGRRTGDLEAAARGERDERLAKLGAETDQPVGRS